jgi:hypothetical protein
MNSILKILLLILVITSGEILSPAYDEADPLYILLPGKQAGPITANTSEQDLRHWFGASNVMRGTGSEGMPITILFDKEPDKRIQIYWEDPNYRTKPSYIEVVAYEGWSSKWHLSNGITIGMTLAQLEELNGGPFDINGYFCDAGGVIHSWKNGKLESIIPADSVAIQMSPTINIYDNEANQEYVRKNLGYCDNKNVSTSQSVLFIKPRIGSIGISIR